MWDLHAALQERRPVARMKGSPMKSTRMIVTSGAAIAAATALVLGGSAAANAHDGSGKSGGKGGALSELVSAGTLTQDEVDAIREAIKTQRETNKAANQAEKQAARDAALAKLVSAGTLTQAQADAIKAADKGGLRELMHDGTIDREARQALRTELRAAHESDRDAKQAERDAARDAALSGLVSDGTLTQSQADAVSSAIASHKDERGPKMGKRGGRGHGGDQGSRGMFGARA